MHAWDSVDGDRRGGWLGDRLKISLHGRRKRIRRTRKMQDQQTATKWGVLGVWLKENVFFIGLNCFEKTFQIGRSVTTCGNALQSVREGYIWMICKISAWGIRREQGLDEERTEVKQTFVGSEYVLELILPSLDDYHQEGCYIQQKELRPRKEQRVFGTMKIGPIWNNENALFW